jgi:triacylglycerol esterase/lipase EstA (alpha/beta hydrolase family)
MYTAVSLCAVVAAIAFGYVAWAVHAIDAGVAPWMVAVGALVAWYGVPLLAIAFWMVLARRFGSPLPPGCRLSGSEYLALYWSEVRALSRVWPRMILYRWLLRDPAPGPAALPVLLLHGVLCNAGVWQGVARRLAADGVPAVYALSYGPPLGSIETFVDQLAAKLAAIRAATGAREVALVGHSMGGLVARAYLRRYGGEGVRVLVTLGTPHHGSMHAYCFPGICLCQMRPDSDWLAALNADEGAPPPCPIVSLWSWHDTMVAPQLSSRLAGATEVTFKGVGHNAMLDDPTVHGALLRALAAAGVPANPASAPAPASRISA